MKTTTLPATGLVRLHQIIGDKKSGTPGVLPISHATFYARIRAGIYPAPIKLGARISMWKVEDVRRMIGESPDNGAPKVEQAAAA